MGTKRGVGISVRKFGGHKLAENEMKQDLGLQCQTPLSDLKFWCCEVCKVYVSNVRLLVHPLLIDFGEGSFSYCCSCCDRGKTKSTPRQDLAWRLKT